MERGIEAPAGCLAGLERKRHDGAQVLTCLDPALAIEPRQLRVRAEPRQEQLEPVELCVDPAHSRAQRARARRIHQALDPRSHGGERVALHHELLVVVTGGAAVTDTDGAAGAADDPDAAGAETLPLGAAASVAAFSRSRRAIARLRRASCLA